jgi:hypothetical protein
VVVGFSTYEGAGRVCRSLARPRPLLGRTLRRAYLASPRERSGRPGQVSGVCPAGARPRGPTHALR